MQERVKNLIKMLPRLEEIGIITQTVLVSRLLHLSKEITVQITLRLLADQVARLTTLRLPADRAVRQVILHLPVGQAAHQVTLHLLADRAQHLATLRLPADRAAAHLLRQAEAVKVEVLLQDADNFSNSQLLYYPYEKYPYWNRYACFS